MLRFEISACTSIPQDGSERIATAAASRGRGWRYGDSATGFVIPAVVGAILSRFGFRLANGFLRWALAALTCLLVALAPGVSWATSAACTDLNANPLSITFTETAGTWSKTYSGNNITVDSSTSLSYTNSFNSGDTIYYSYNITPSGGSIDTTLKYEAAGGHNIYVNQNTGSTSSYQLTTAATGLAILVNDISNSTGTVVVQISCTAPSVTPTVTSISPVSGPATGGTPVTITGTNLASATAVLFGATPATSITSDTSGQIVAVAPAESAGAVDVTVTTAGGTSAVSAADKYTYVAAPTVTAISPASGPTGGANSVTITGTNLGGATSVMFGSTAASSITSDASGQIVAVAPAGSAGAVDVTVTTAGGTSAVSAADKYTYVAAPTVTAISPSSGPTAGGQSVTISGTGFTGATSVSIGGAAVASFHVSSATTITAATPAGTAGAASVLVTTPGGVNAANTLYAYVSAPTVTAISPSSGPTAGGQSVTITGTGFTGATSVSIGGAAVASFHVSSARTITAATPAGTAGAASVLVTTPGGVNPANKLYVYQGSQTIVFTSTAPTHATVGGPSYHVTATGGASGKPVTFTIDSSGASGACAISGSVVKFSAPGKCVIDANQAGDANYQAAPQVQQAIHVSKPSAQLVLMASSTSPLQGVPVTFTVTLTGGISPTGTVTFRDGSTVLGTVRVFAGMASLTVPSFSPGLHTITAFYSGDANNPSLTSTVATINVGARPNPAGNSDVTGQVASEVATAERFAQTQLDNTNHRLEEIHDEQDPDNSAGGSTSKSIGPVASGHAPDSGASVAGSASPYGDLSGASGLAGVAMGSTQPSPGGASTAGSVPPLNGRVPVLGDPGAGAAASNPLLAYTPLYPDDTPAQQSAAGRMISTLGSALPGAFTALNKTMDLPFHLWSAGAFDFGDLQTNGNYGNHFTTSGLTIGADRKFSNGLTVGLAIGGGLDYNTLGSDGTSSSATSFGATAYASYALGPHTFVDVDAGYGLMRYDLKRWSSDGDVMLSGSRGGSDLYGSVSLTQDVKLGNWKLSPYGRLEAIDIHLDPYTEAGSSVWALSYDKVGAASINGVAGARIAYPIPKDWGVLTPMLRLEYSHAFGGGYSQDLGYAGLAASNYTINGEPILTDEYTVGLILKAEVANDLSMDIEYSFSGSRQQFQGQQIRATVSHAF